MYTYNISDNKVVCVSHFAGKAVRGIAKCDLQFDNFDEDTGMKLSKKRCDVKVAQKRLKRADSKLAQAIADLELAEQQFDRMSAYRADAMIQLSTAKKDLEEFENTLK